MAGHDPRTDVAQIILSNYIAMTPTNPDAAEHFYTARVSIDGAIACSFTEVLQSPHSSFAPNTGIHIRQHWCRFKS